MPKYIQWLVSLTLLVISTSPLRAAELPWQDITPAAKDSVSNVNGRLFRGNEQQIRSRLAFAPHESLGDRSLIIELPMPNGEVEQFSAVESPITVPGDPNNDPSIQTFQLYGISDPRASGKADLTTKGFRAMIQNSSGIIFIDPDPQLGQDVFKTFRPNMKPRNGHQFYPPRIDNDRPARTSERGVHRQDQISQRVSGQLTTFRMAVSATQEFVSSVGGSTSDATSEITTTINRINFLYERDFGLRLLLVGNNGLLIEQPSDNTFSNDDLGQMHYENVTWLDQQLGREGYDLGHVFSNGGGGGLAGLGVACYQDRKGWGSTSNAGLSGDDFYIGYVGHEIGHQLYAHHTYNGQTSSCSGRSGAGATAVEPGSGSTVMSYAGICGAENLQNVTDVSFHAASIEEVHDFTESSWNTCSGTVFTGNSDPVLQSVANLIIPANTPFRLEISASDSDSNTLSYQWDQNDPGGSSGATNSSSFGTDTGNNPLFRSFEPQPVSWRDFPALGTQVTNNTDDAEVLPTQPRTINFVATVRDGDSGQATENVAVSVTNSSGFEVTSQNNGGTLNTTGAYVVSWDAAGTDGSPVNCAQVDIDLLTFSAGYSCFSEHPIASGVSNGAESIEINTSLPFSHPRARIRVSCSSNIFYDISNSDLAVVGGNSTLFSDKGNKTYFNENGYGYTLSGNFNPVDTDCEVDTNVDSGGGNTGGNTGGGGNSGGSEIDIGALSPGYLLLLSSLLLLRLRRSRV